MFSSFVICTHFILNFWGFTHRGPSHLGRESCPPLFGLSSFVSPGAQNSEEAQNRLPQAGGFFSCMPFHFEGIGDILKAQGYHSYFTAALRPHSLLLSLLGKERAGREYMLGLADVLDHSAENGACIFWANSTEGDKRAKTASPTFFLFFFFLTSVTRAF